MTWDTLDAGWQDASGVSAPARGRIETRLERLKERFLKAILAATQEPRLTEVIRWAALEATAMAWIAPFPLLVFPCLFEEKVQLAITRWKRQQEIRQRSHKPLSGAQFDPDQVMPAKPAEDAFMLTAPTNIAPIPFPELAAAQPPRPRRAPLRQRDRKAPARPASLWHRPPASSQHIFGPPRARR